MSFPLLTTSLRERFRAWLHRDCRRERGMVGALLEVGGQLAELSRYSRELTAAVVERPELVTVIAYGMRGPGPGGATLGGFHPGLNWVVVDSKKVEVKPGGMQTIELECIFPIQDFQVLVLANLDRVDIQCVAKASTVLAIGSPVVLGRDWLLGQRVRVVVELRCR